jgi:hypothetical protein
MEKIYVQLINEGTTAYRPVLAERDQDGVFTLPPWPDYGPEFEEWEFPPGSRVICEYIDWPEGRFLVAVRAAV